MISSEIMGHVGPVPSAGVFFNRLFTVTWNRFDGGRPKSSLSRVSGSTRTGSPMAALCQLLNRPSLHCERGWSRLYNRRFRRYSRLLS
jgi:hypothetical protein